MPVVGGHQVCVVSSDRFSVPFRRVKPCGWSRRSDAGARLNKGACDRVSARWRRADGNELGSDLGEIKKT